MSKNLLIVESPAKARTIGKYLGPDFIVKASVGHIVDLPPSELGVDLENGFQPHYRVIKGKDKVIKELRAAAAKAGEIFLAPDPDREGEAIAMHIAQQLGRPLESYHRVLFHELTKSAIAKAVAAPAKIDVDRYNSQQARRVLDRLVGYQISPLLWDKVKRGLSAGRVQSVSLRLVVERERAIQAFEPQEYWTVTAMLQGQQPPPFAARLARLAGKKFDPKNEKEAMAGVTAIQGQRFVVEKLTKRQRKQQPAPPFITSTLQQEAYRKLGFAPKYTMGLAQALYEGKQTSEGQMGLITYMRTDSTRLAAEAVATVRALIAARYGQEYLPAKPNAYKSKANAQEAHEAIRPTNAALTPELLEAYLSRDELRLYQLIWNRFVACQMAPAIHDQTQAEISAGQGLLRASGQVLRFRGFTAVYVEGRDEHGGDEARAAAEAKDHDQALPPLPPLDEGQELALQGVEPKQHFTQPPPRFTEASLVRELEERGIGRPSTYAAILSTIQEKDYVSKDQKRRLIPSELGYLVNDLLVECFPQIMEVGFTAQLEGLLDQVEEGRQDWRGLLADFYGPFQQALGAAKTHMRQIKGKGVETDVKCPLCGKPMAIRLGRNGEFLACSGYPECKSTSDFSRDEKGAIVLQEAAPDPGVACDKCGAAMVVKKGRFGPFLACSAYPQCKNIMALGADGKPVAKPQPEATGEKCPKCGGELVIKPTRSGGRFISCANYPKCNYSKGLSTGVKCPKCGGELVEKRSRRGKPFYGCDNFPSCDYASWDRPIDEPCPQCGHPFLVEKVGKKGAGIRCPQPDCNFKK